VRTTRGSGVGQAWPRAGRGGWFRTIDRLGDEVRDGAGYGVTTTDVLDASGYGPRSVGGEIRFANCPFDALVEDHRPLICSANVALAAGLVHELDPSGPVARLDPQPGWCCVAIGPSTEARGHDGGGPGPA
jgi:hypothetical protein